MHSIALLLQARLATQVAGNSIASYTACIDAQKNRTRTDYDMLESMGYFTDVIR